MPDSGQLAPGDEHEFSVRAKVTLRAKGARGQFSIFGAVEENAEPGFPKLGGIKQWLRNIGLNRGIAVVFVCTKKRYRNLVQWAAGISTAGAQEMQKGSFKVSRFQGFKEEG